MAAAEARAAREHTANPCLAASGPGQATPLSMPDNQNLAPLPDSQCPQISKDHCSDESSHCIRDGVREVPQKVYAECVESDQAVKKEESNALVQAEKTEPSWHIIDKDELASMVTQKSVEHVENCDLPQPLTKDFRKGQLPSLELPGYCETLPSSLDWPIQEVFSDLSNHHWGRSTSVKCR
ncbi:Uncharacterized protein TCM_015435 [Theobroma cacao]|uniref:Uncharacterized protein n=1 Tax=Theobroma cacao TaxID=3641 RepID=A0A061G318_THECC|nr:Uncharacterized protein TCM_015435 [Theobroma cacao]